jgi:hypothetical protein
VADLARDLHRAAGAVRQAVDLGQASSSLQPRSSLSAALFQLTMMPSRVLLTIASPDDSTMLASCSRACTARLCSVMSSSDAIQPSTLPVASVSGR